MDTKLTELRTLAEQMEVPGYNTLDVQGLKKAIYLYKNAKKFDIPNFKRLKNLKTLERKVNKHVYAFNEMALRVEASTDDVLRSLAGKLNVDITGLDMATDADRKNIVRRITRVLYLKKEKEARESDCMKKTKIVLKADASRLHIKPGNKDKQQLCDAIERIQACSSAPRDDVVAMAERAGIEVGRKSRVNLCVEKDQIPCMSRIRKDIEVDARDKRIKYIKLLKKDQLCEALENAPSEVPCASKKRPDVVGEATDKGIKNIQKKSVQKLCNEIAEKSGVIPMPPPLVIRPGYKEPCLKNLKPTIQDEALKFNIDTRGKIKKQLCDEIAMAKGMGGRVIVRNGPSNVRSGVSSSPVRQQVAATTDVQSSDVQTQSNRIASQQSQSGGRVIVRRGPSNVTQQSSRSPVRPLSQQLDVDIDDDNIDDNVDDDVRPVDRIVNQQTQIPSVGGRVIPRVDIGHQTSSRFIASSPIRRLARTTDDTTGIPLTRRVTFSSPVDDKVLGYPELIIPKSATHGKKSILKRRTSSLSPVRRSSFVTSTPYGSPGFKNTQNNILQTASRSPLFELVPTNTRQDINTRRDQSPVMLQGSPDNNFQTLPPPIPVPAQSSPGQYYPQYDIQLNDGVMDAVLDDAARLAEQLPAIPVAGQNDDEIDELLETVGNGLMDDFDTISNYSDMEPSDDDDEEQDQIYHTQPIMQPVPSPLYVDLIDDNEITATNVGDNASYRVSPNLTVSQIETLNPTSHLFVAPKKRQVDHRKLDEALALIRGEPSIHATEIEKLQKLIFKLV